MRKQHRGHHPYVPSDSVQGAVPSASSVSLPAVESTPTPMQNATPTPTPSPSPTTHHQPHTNGSHAFTLMKSCMNNQINHLENNIVPVSNVMSSPPSIQRLADESTISMASCSNILNALLHLLDMLPVSARLRVLSHLQPSSSPPTSVGCTVLPRTMGALMTRPSLSQIKQ